jgi:hypothetical protein
VRLRIAVPSLALLTLGACQSKDETNCRSQYLASHVLVSDVDTNDLESVESTLKAVDESLAVCQRAVLQEEIEQLKGAKRKLESHHGYLVQRQAKRELTPEELAKVVANGDPRCPRGQSYTSKKSPQKIRCTGPQVIQMNWAEVREHFASRGFKLADTGATLSAEFGSESYRYSFKKREDSEAAPCVVVYSQPGIAWQETVARVTGLPPRRLKEGQPVTLGDRQIAFKVTGDETQAVLTFGECPVAP